MPDLRTLYLRADGREKAEENPLDRRRRVPRRLCRSVRGIATEKIKRIGAYAPPFSFREVKRIKTDKKGKKTA